MGEPRAITYKEVRKAADTDAGASETWAKIGEITGAGHVPASEDATIDLTDVSDGKRERIDKLVSGTKDEPEAANTSTKRGTK